jgi:hypothetical protein
MVTAALDVETDLAASIVAMWACVRADLTQDRPRIDHIREQSTAAWRANRVHWKALVRDAAAQLAGRVSSEYADQLGDLLARGAAQGLAGGMDIQLSRGQNPEVAWQRVLVGYGLDARTMRGLLGGAQVPNTAGGAGASPDSLARTAVRTLLRQAETLAHREVAAWAGIKEEIAKAGFDPKQPRDAHGEFARTEGRGPKLKLKEPPPALFEPLVVAPEAATVDPEVKPVVDPSRFHDPARFHDPSRFHDPARFHDPNRFAEPAKTVDQSRFTDRSRFTDQSRFTETPRTEYHLLNRTLMIVLGGIKSPEGAPTDELDDPRGQLHIPMQDIAGYIHFPWAGAKTANLTSLKTTKDGTFVDFGLMRLDHEAQDLPWEPVEARYGREPDRSVDPDLPELDDFATWGDLGEKALPIWRKAYEEPAKYAAKLDEGDLDVIWHDAGLGGTPSKAEVLAKVGELQDTLDMDHEPDDPSLRNALADHVAWRRPDVAGSDGEAFYDELREHYSDTDIHDHVPPGVLVFPKGLADDDDASDMHGQYKVTHVEYVSGLGSHGTGVREGIIGVQKIYLEPRRSND